MKDLKKVFFTFLFFSLLSSPGLLAGKVIQSQDSTKWDGIQVNLTYLRIKNDILTFRFKYKNIGPNSEELYFVFRDFYIIDESNQKKFYALKDSDNNYLGGPMSSHYKGGVFEYDIEPGSSKGLWIKFPVPPDHPETITINVPGMFPFEDVVLPK